MDYEANGQPIIRHFHIADYVVFSLTLVISLLIGIYYACSGGRQRTVQEYLLGNRNMGVVPIAMSLLASFLSAIGMIAVPSEVYMYGAGIFFIIIGIILAIPIVSFCYLPMFYNLKLTSVYEYIEKRFDSRIRKIGSLMYIFQMVIYISFVIYVPGLALSQVTGLNMWISVFSIGILGTVYTSIGGIKAVMWTDVFQVTLMFLALSLAVIKGALDLGGFTAVISRNLEGERMKPISLSVDPRIRYTLWNVTIGGLSTWVAVYGTNQAQVQRYLTSPTLRQAKRTLWWNLLGLFFFNFLIVFSGLVIYAKYWDCDPIEAKLISAPDQIFPFYVMETFGNLPGVPGLFVAGIFSGSLSTVSSALNSLAAITLEDFVKAFAKWKNITSEKAALVSKCIACSYGILCLILVTAISRLGAIMQASSYNSEVFGGILFGLFTLGMFIPWANRTGAYAGIGCSLLFSLWVSIGSQMHPQFTPKAPISTEGCSDLYSNYTQGNNSVWTTAKNYSDPLPTDLAEDTFILYQIPFVWIQFIATSTVIIVGSIVSLLTGPTKLYNLDLNLISPVIKSLLKNFFRSDLEKSKDHEDTKDILMVSPVNNTRL